MKMSTFQLNNKNTMNRLPPNLVVLFKSKVDSFGLCYACEIL